MSAADWGAVRLTAERAALSTLLLLVGTPIAWWLARTRSATKPLLASLVAMPPVLPPPLLVRITRRGCEILALAPGDALYAQVKGVAPM